MSSLGESVTDTAKSANEVSKTLKESNKEKSRSVTNSAKFFRIRREAVRRREREDLIEAQSSTGPFSTARKVITQSTRGFLGRIMDFLGAIILGWAVVNLPKIITAVEKLVERLQTYFGILKGFFDGTYRLISSFIGGVRDAIVNIATLDFEGLKSTIDIRMEEMNDAVETMGADYDKLVTELSGDTKSVLKKLGFNENDFKLPNLLGGEEEPEASEAPTVETETSEQPMETPTVNLGQLTNIVPTGNYKGIGLGDQSLPGTTSMRGPRWGRHHAGVDIGTSGESGWHVAFALSGVVSDAGTFGTYGKLVVITCGNKDFTFAHLKRIDVRKGQKYNGQIIGEIGNTGGGNNTGNHLHFEAAPAGKGGRPGHDLDPMPYVKYLRIGRLGIGSPQTQFLARENSDTSGTVTTDSSGRQVEVNPATGDTRVIAADPRRERQKTVNQTVLENLIQVVGLLAAKPEQEESQPQVATLPVPLPADKDSGSKGETTSAMQVSSSQALNTYWQATMFTKLS